MPTNLTPSLSIIGASGLDTTAIIEALANARRGPILRLEAQKARLQKQSTEFGTLRARFEALRAKAAAIDTAGELRSVLATSSNPSGVTVNAASSAAEGTYAVTVNTLAQAHSELSSGFAQKSGLAIGSGVVQFDVGGVKYDVSIGAGSDLEAIRDAINAHEAPVTASIIDDGSGVDQYKLVVTSDTTGAASSFTVNLSGFTPASPLSLSFSTISSGQNASLTVNGVTVTRPTNNVTDLIPGLTFNLLLENSSSTVTVSKDREGVKKKIKDLVDAFNDVIDLFKTHANAAAKDSTAVLYGDPTLNGAQRTLRGIIGLTVSGTGSAYDTLSKIGITTAADGKLSVDATKLDEALNGDYGGVIALFTQASTGIAAQAQSVTLSFQNSSLKSRTDGIQTRIRNINGEVDRLELRLEKYIDTLRKKFTALDALAGQLQAQGASLSQLGS